MAKQQLLLIERDPKTRRVLKLGLQQAGYAVSTAQDGEVALAKLRRRTPALVITSTELPKLDGYALVRRMRDRAKWADIPVIFMVAAHSIADKIRGLELGVEEYLDKPVFLKELQTRVQVLLAKRIRRSLSDAALTTRVQGSLADIAPIDLISSLEQGKRSGLLTLINEERRGRIWFHSGEVVDAELGELRGEEAFFRLLGWTDGRFETDQTDRAPAEYTIEMGSRRLVDAAVRHLGQLNAALAKLPGRDELIEADLDLLEQRMGAAPAALLPLLELLDGTRDIYELLDESPFDDLSTLDTLLQLQTEGLFAPGDDVRSGRPADGDDADWDEDDTPINEPPRTDLPAAAPAADAPPPSSDPDVASDPATAAEPAVGRGSRFNSSEHAAISEPAPSSEPLPSSPPPSSREGAVSQPSTSDAGVPSEAPSTDPAGTDAAVSTANAARSWPGLAVSDKAGDGFKDIGPESEEEIPQLSESGVSDSFFASQPPPEPAEEDDWTDSGPISEYLTEEQRERQQRSRNLVMLVVGGLALAGVLAVARAAFKDDPPPRRTAEPVASAASSTLTTAATSVATAAPPASAEATAEPSATVSASATASASASADPALPDVPEPLAEAKKLLNIGRYTDAIPMARAAIAKDPSNGDAYFYLATALQSIGKNPEAMDVYSDCLATADKGLYLSYCKRYGKLR